MSIGQGLDLWHEADETTYVTLGRRTFALQSDGFELWLRTQFRRQQNGAIPPQEAVNAAVRTLESIALHDRPERVANVRVAGLDGVTYLHLRDDADTVIEIDADGWRTCEILPDSVRFVRPKTALPLPMPVRSDRSLRGRLGEFVNLADDDTLALALAWATAALRPVGPYPVLVLTGEQGSAKTSTGRIFKRLIDPCEAADRGSPREERDLMIRCRANWVLSFDNIGVLPDWLSDCFCRLSTGGGFGTRQLYTDREEIIFSASRPLTLNGIEDFVERGDLLDRAILVRHPPLDPRRRRAEDEFWAAFQAVHPELLGLVLDRVSAGMQELPRVKLDQLPRMAGFLQFSVACERAAGEEAAVERAYAENQQTAYEQALDVSPVPAVLVAYMEGRRVWQGSATDLLTGLLAKLPTRAGSGDPILPQGWPKQPHILTNTLTRLAPALRRARDLEVVIGRESNSGRRRFVRITNLSQQLSSNNGSRQEDTDDDEI